MNLHNKDVIHIHYDINLACNNRCPYCFKLSRLDNKKLVNLEVFNDVINAVNNLKEEQPNYNLNLHLLGGEPLLTIDETIEFIERTTDKNVGLDVYTNLNFEPDSDNIKKILQFHKINKFFRLTVSWHLSSNQQLIKHNIKKCEKFSIILLLVSDDTMDIVYENFKWLRKNVNSKYCIEEIIVDGISTFTMFDDERYIEMVESSLDSEELDVIDGKEFSYIESRQLLTNISQKYYKNCCNETVTSFILTVCITILILLMIKTFVFT